MPTTRKPIGGRSQQREIATVKKQLLFKPSEWDEVEKSLGPGQRPGTFIQDLVLNVARGLLPSKPGEVPAVVASTNQFTAPIISAVPCGPWDEAMESSRYFTMSAENAEFLELRDGDVWAPANGHSMEGAGITDGALVAYYPGLACCLGSVKAAVFLCQLIHWHGKGHNADGWIYKTHAEWELETGLTKEEQMTVCKLLRELGILKERYERQAHRKYYSVDFDRLAVVWADYAGPGGKRADRDISLDSFGVQKPRRTKAEVAESKPKPRVPIPCPTARPTN